MRQSEYTALVSRGVIVPPTALIVSDELKSDLAKFKGAMDAVPGLITSPNQGIPAYLANYLDPETVEIVTKPMRSTEIYGETQKGDWTTLTAMFRVIERTGEVSSYGDFNTNGRGGHNTNYVTRQSYHFQAMTEWGERETDLEALAGVNYIAEQNNGTALVMAKFHNLANFFGIANLQCYGALNDPNLIAAISPSTKAAGGVTWSAPATADEVYEDIRLLVQQLQKQLGGHLDKTDNMTIGLSPTKFMDLDKANSFNVSVYDKLKKGYPNLKVVAAPEFTTAGGELMQLKLDKFDGKDTTYCAFTEKMRAHAVVQKASSWEQKKSGGTFGAIIRYPVAIAGMLGI